METKHCRACDTVKPVSEFGKQSSAKDGLRARCKKCMAAGTPLKRQPTQREDNQHYAREKWAAIQARKAGMNLEAFMSNRERPCDICFSAEDPLSPYKGHGTEVLGWICRKCNRGLGLLMHDPDLLERSLRMLRR